MMTDRTLTPYDTGERLEPHLWVRGEVASPGGLPRRACVDDYGRVDFENEEGGTVLTVHVSRTAGGYTLHVENLTDPILVEVESPE
jgi:hypothetical protein